MDSSKFKNETEIVLKFKKRSLFKCSFDLLLVGNAGFSEQFQATLSSL